MPLLLQRRCGFGEKDVPVRAGRHAMLPYLSQKVSEDDMRRINYPFRYSNSFQENLRNLMKLNKITQSELANYIGTSRQQVSFYCDGSSIPNIERAVKIAEFFSVSLDDLSGINIQKIREEQMIHASEIRNRVPTRDLYIQLAEEAAELSAAASKMARILGGENPTPVSDNEGRLHLVEEFTDVKLCADVLGLSADQNAYYYKRNRWIKRLLNKKG